MRRNSLSFLLYELIGKKVRVCKSSSKDLQNLEGIILFETKSTFLVQTSNGRKVVPKKGNWFFFPEFEAQVRGLLLDVRPQDRTKKLYKKFAN